MKLRFTNHSVSGTYRKYGTFALEIPGQRGSEPAVVEIDVPDELVENVKGYLKDKHPAVAVEEVAEQAPAEVETELVVETAEETVTEVATEVAVEEVAEQAPVKPAPKGGKKK